MSAMVLNTNTDTNTVEEINPFILLAKANAEDNPNWHQAMNGPFKDGFWEATKVEINTLENEMNAWEVVDIEEWMNILDSTWAFKVKRNPAGEIKKLKARFCARGDQQLEGIDFFETYAPVINWHTVRIMLVLSILFELQTIQVDYTAAFIHAPID